MEGSNKDSGHKHRLKGFFSKEKKVTTDQEEVDNFLHGDDKFIHTFPAPSPGNPERCPASPPKLSRLDTSNARRWPTAAEVQSLKESRGRSVSLKPRRKGLAVRFTDEKPEIIGEGGDEAESPTIHVRNRANSHPPDKGTGTKSSDTEVLKLGQVERRFESIPAGPVNFSLTQHTLDVESLENEYSKTGSHEAASFNAKVKADMRAGEGKALVRAASFATKEIDQQLLQAESPGASFNLASQLDELQINTIKNVNVSAVPAQLVPGHPYTAEQNLGAAGEGSNPTSRSSTLLDSPVPIFRASTSKIVVDSPMTISRSSTLKIHEAAIAIGDEALQAFSMRVAHLFTLFRLSAESVGPLSKYTIGEFTRAALWWFLQGRLNLECLRNIPVSPEGQHSSISVRQQAYTDLAKCLWIIDTITPNYPELQGTSNPSLTEILETRQGIMSSLRKLTMSMQKNNFLPPEEAPLSQGLDYSIWVREDGESSLLASQKHMSAEGPSSSMPLGDSSQMFHYYRMFVKGALIEKSEMQQYRCPLLLSLVRHRKSKELSMFVTNQSGTLKMYVQSEKRHGPTWQDVKWHAKSCMIEVNLPRGFLLQLHCPLRDFRPFYSFFNYYEKIHGDLRERLDEHVIFESTLKSFQYFDKAETSTFPKELLPYCQLRVFEKILVEKAGSGVMNWHQGYRIALATDPSTKTLSGISQDIPTSLPVQFSFLRGEGGLPAFLLKIDDEKSQSKYSMTFTFEDAKDRSLLHTNLTGVSLTDREAVITKSRLMDFTIMDPSGTTKDADCFKGLEWQEFRIIGQDQDDLPETKTAVSRGLRIVMDFKVGSITDRVNVAPGQLIIRLDVNFSNVLSVLRHPQRDLTLSVVESQVSRKFPHDIAEVLQTISSTSTIRKYSFPSLIDLHLFQAALTGFSVSFDGMASSFSIARRRMVVPIYKKWDASTTRLQIIQRKSVVQLLAFFENFSHGHCMNFALKSTDVFETSSKIGKFAVRIVDAKFALPKTDGQEGAGIDRRFVCLDPEYPGEHDDIVIVFDNEPDQERFVKALPAPAKIASRIGSIRR